MNVEIITPDKELFKGEASLVQLPGIDGLFEILNHHAPLISALKAGKVKITDDKEQSQFFEIRGGVVEVLDNKVLVLAE
ncbi:MAG: ATP synthase F1 subunit epsilon [Bacteroidales bacterium]|nr:ATP synthase F1 subunit epsilon [Bacteroidales bacterium]